MISFTLNGLDVFVEEGTTLLEAAKFYGFPIPTLCHMEGLSPYGACRLCVVEVGKEPNSKLVTSCTYRVEEGLYARTATIVFIPANMTERSLLNSTGEPDAVKAACPVRRGTVAKVIDSVAVYPTALRGREVEITSDRQRSTEVRSSKERSRNTRRR